MGRLFLPIAIVLFSGPLKGNYREAKYCRISLS